MAVGTGTPYNVHTGNGVTTVFAYGFTVLAAGDLVATVDGVTTSVTVSGVGDPGGGYVVFSSAPASGSEIILQRVLELVRLVDYQTNGDLLAATLNADLDRLLMMIQGLGADADRSIKAPFPEVLDDMPAAAARADRMLAFDGDGQPAISSFTEAQVAAVITAAGFDGVTSSHVSSVHQQTVTAGTTVITVPTYTTGVGAIALYADGVRLAPDEYTETNSTTVTLDDPFASDVVLVSVVGRLVTSGAVAEQIGYTAGGTGGEERPLDDVLDDFVNVRNYGVTGDGTTNDRTKLQAVFDQFKRVYIPSGTYYMGQFAAANRIIDLSALGEGITIKTDKDVQFVCETTANVQPMFFYLENNSHFRCGPIKFLDTGYDPGVTWRGAQCFALHNDTGLSWGDLVFDAIYANDCIAAVNVYGRPAATDRIRGIHIKQLFCDDCYYGYVGADQGDGVTIDNLVAYQCIRPYFVYGVTAHKVNIFARANRSASGSVNISRSVGGFDTSGIDVRYIARDQTLNITHVLVNHVDLLGGVIRDVKLHIDIESSTIYTPLRFVNYTGSGGSETSASSLNNVFDIEVSGSCDVQAAEVAVVASYAAKGIMRFRNGDNFAPGASVLAAFLLNAANRAGSPTWTGSGGNPSLGNGTLVQSYDLVDGLLTVTTKLTIGSTTTLGTGEWTFSLPYTAYSDAIGQAYILDSGTTYYTGIVRVQSTGSTAQVFLNNNASAAGAANPITWATGDQLIFTVTYPVA